MHNNILELLFYHQAAHWPALFTVTLVTPLHCQEGENLKLIKGQGGSLKVTAFTLCYLPCSPGLPPSLRLSNCNTESLSFCLSSTPLLPTTFLSTKLALRRPFSILESLQEEEMAGWPKESERPRVARARSV